MTQEVRPAIAAGVSVRDRISPVGVWSGLGVAAVALQVWVLGRWLIFGELRSAPPSGYRISGARVTVAWTFQVVVAATVLSIGIVLVRRCLRERTVTFDAALYTGLVLSMWQDPILYWNRLYVVYNQNLPNVETWGPYIPGWHGPDTGGQPIYESVAGGSGLAYPIVMVWFWLQYRLGDVAECGHGREGRGNVVPRRYGRVSGRADGHRTTPTEVAVRGRGGGGDRLCLIQV